MIEEPLKKIYVQSWSLEIIVSHLYLVLLDTGGLFTLITLPSEREGKLERFSRLFIAVEIHKAQGNIRKPFL